MARWTKGSASVVRNSTHDFGSGKSSELRCSAHKADIHMQGVTLGKRDVFDQQPQHPLFLFHLRARPCGNPQHNLGACPACAPHIQTAADRLRTFPHPRKAPMSHFVS